LRDYVDDLALRVVDKDPHKRAWRLRHDLDALRAASEADNMPLNFGKEQIWIPLASGRAAWAVVAGPSTKGTQNVRHVVIQQRAPWAGGDPLPSKIEALRPVMRRLGRIPRAAEYRGRIASAAVFFGEGLVRA